MEFPKEKTKYIRYIVAMYPVLPIVLDCSHTRR